MKKLILVIDIQKEYIANGRPYYIKSIESSLEKAQAVLQAARANKIPVWHVQHKQDGSIFAKDSALVDFIPGFEPLNNEPIFIKDMYSCFSSADFSQSVAKQRPEEIIIIGYGTAKCCLCTIIDGIHRGFKFKLIEDACAAVGAKHADEAQMHISAINILKQYADVVDANSLIHTIKN